MTLKRVHFTDSIAYCAMGLVHLDAKSSNAFLRVNVLERCA